MIYTYLKQLGKESLIYGISGVSARFLSIFLVPIYTRIFTPEDYGVMGLITTTTGLLQILVVLALDNSAARWFYESEESTDQKSTIATWVWCQFFISILVGMVLIVAGDWIGLLITGKGDTGIYFRINGAILPLLTLSTAVINWLRFQRRAMGAVVFTIFNSTMNIMLSVLFVIILHLGLEGVYLAQLMTAGICTIIAALIMKDWIIPTYFRRSRLVEMLRYSLPLIPASIAFWVVNLSGRYFIQAFSTTSEVGLYQLGANIAMFTALVTQAFQLAWGPFSLSIHKQPEARNIYANVFLIYIWITVWLSTALALFAPEAIQILATSVYLGASQVVGVLSFSYVFIGLYYIANIGPAIVKDMRPLGIAMIVSAVLTILLNILLVPILGKMGSALATLISQASVPIYVFYRSQKLYPIPYRFLPATGIFIMAFLLILCSSLIDTTSIWSSILIKSALLALFIPALFLFRVVSIEQLQFALNTQLKKQ